MAGCRLWTTAASVYCALHVVEHELCKEAKRAKEKWGETCPFFKRSALLYGETSGFSQKCTVQPNYFWFLMHSAVQKQPWLQLRAVAEHAERQRERGHGEKRQKRWEKQLHRANRLGRRVQERHGGRLKIKRRGQGYEADVSLMTSYEVLDPSTQSYVICDIGQKSTLCLYNTYLQLYAGKNKKQTKKKPCVQYSKYKAMSRARQHVNACDACLPPMCSSQVFIYSPGRRPALRICAKFDTSRPTESAQRRRNAWHRSNPFQPGLLKNPTGIMSITPTAAEGVVEFMSFSSLW